MSKLSVNIKEALLWVERESNLRTRQARMLSNGVQGEFLQAFSLMIKPKNILEIGTFTGYSTLCLARGLSEGGHIDAIEINDELEDIIMDGYARGGLIGGDEDVVSFRLGDAKVIIPTLNREYDLVYIDANKREYSDYYNMVFDKVVYGGYILADNLLWSGKAMMENPPEDEQTRSIIAFNRLILNDLRVESVILPIRDGIGVIYKKNDHNL